jgi:glycosyltransferase involved in cell wall biosynthesis
VHAWAEGEVAVPFQPTVPVHRGTLAEALDVVRHDVVLTHWLHIGARFRDVTAEAGIPHVVRSHGFDMNTSVVEALLRDPGVLVHLFPHHFHPWSWHPRAVSTPIAFDATRYTPTPGKDRQLVLRLLAGLLTKDIEVFLEAAKRCPDHRFVIGIGHVTHAEEKTEKIIELAEQLEAPVDIRVDVSFDEAAKLVSSAGIYLHTHGTDHPLGMPVSLAESMATGSVALARDLPGMASYLGSREFVYGGATVDDRADHAAAIIQATSRWTDERWDRAWRASVDTAWTRFPNDLVAADMVSAWRERLGVGTP